MARQQLQVYKGKVRWFDAQRGYGFLYAEGLPKDVFVHYSGISADGYRKLAEDQEVEFQVTQTDKGLMAVAVTIL